MTEETTTEETSQSAKVGEIIETISGLTVLELAELVKALEDKFGVSATAPVMMAGVSPAAVDGGVEEEEEKDAFDVLLTGSGDKKIQVIKVVRQITSLGLKEAKALVDDAPNPVKEGVSKQEAEEIQTLLQDAGATVEVK
jgi:large subunit ribosomal protein L7/L12